MVSLSAMRDRLELIDEEDSSPTYACDLAAATREIIDGALPSGIYHRTNAGSCTWYGFAKEIFRITGWRGAAVPVPASAFPRPATRPAYSMLRSTKLPPMRRWEEALREYLAEIRNPNISARGGSPPKDGHSALGGEIRNSAQGGCASGAKSEGQKFKT
jgi:dTDP-4-dehydrorhamnose reductase